MKKTITAIVVVLAIGGAAIWYFVARPANGGGSTAAAVVPSQTLLYIGASGSNEFVDSMRVLRRANMQSLQGNFDKYREVAPRFGQAGLFVEGLLEAYVDQLEQGKFIPGMPESPQAVAYTVGIVPVVRIRLTDAAAFKQFLDDAAQRGGAQATAGSYQGVSYREYAIKLDDKPTRSSLLVAVRPDHVVFTFDTPKWRDETLPLALGLEKPATSLAQSGLLQQIKDRNGFASGYIGFLNHQAFVAALTGAPDSLAGRMLTQVDAKNQLAPLREPACRQDIQSIAKVWPITVFGVLPNDAAASGEAEIHEQIVSRLTDPSLVATLSKLRGHIPAALLDGSEQPMLAVALGLDVSSFAPVLSDLQQRFIQADFHCDFLVDAQQQVRQKNPAAMTVAAALFSGVRGVSLSLFDFHPAPGAAPSTGIDALINISATNPRMLFQMAQRMRPDFFGNVQLPADGQSVPLLQKPGAPQVRVMVNGSHLVLFAGPQASKVASNLGTGELEPNGMVFYHVDYGRLMPLLANVLSKNKGEQKGDAAQLQALQENLQRVGQSKLRIRGLLDIAKPGVVVDVKAAAAKSQPQG